MGSITIEGGHRLSGETVVQGAKNSVLPVLAATLLCGGACRIRRCPRLSDVDAAADILRYLGCRADWEDGDLLVDSSVLTRCDIPQTLMRRMRSSVIFLGGHSGPMRLGGAQLSRRLRAGAAAHRPAPGGAQDAGRFHRGKRR